MITRGIETFTKRCLKEGDMLNMSIYFFFIITSFHTGRFWFASSLPLKDFLSVHIYFTKSTTIRLLSLPKIKKCAKRKIFWHRYCYWKSHDRAAESQKKTSRNTSNQSHNVVISAFIAKDSILKKINLNFMWTFYFVFNKTFHHIFWSDLILQSTLLI